MLKIDSSSATMELLKTVGSSGTVALLKNNNNRRISGQQKICQK